MLPLGVSFDTSSIASTSVDVDSRSSAGEVTVFFDMKFEASESTGTPNAIVMMAPVGSHVMTIRLCSV